MNGDINMTNNNKTFADELKELHQSLINENNEQIAKGGNSSTN